MGGINASRALPCPADLARGLLVGKNRTKRNDVVKFKGRLDPFRLRPGHCDSGAAKSTDRGHSLEIGRHGQV
jgi:hypothetical protein